jgi:hypothetical protein
VAPSRLDVDEEEDSLTVVSDRVGRDGESRLEGLNRGRAIVCPICVCYPSRFLWVTGFGFSRNNLEDDVAVCIDKVDFIAIMGDSSTFGEVMNLGDRTLASWSDDRLGHGGIRGE